MIDTDFQELINLANESVHEWALIRTNKEPDQSSPTKPIVEIFRST